MTRVGEPAVVLGLVLLELAFGGLLVLVLAPTWGQTRAGFVVLLGATLALLALGAWAALRGPLAATGAAGADLGAVTWAQRGTLATTVAAALTAIVGLRSQRVARIVAVVAAAAAAATLVPLASLRGADATGGMVQGIAELALGGVFVGAVWNSLILGHWYLVERRLSNRHMVWMAWVNAGAVAAGLASVVLSGRNPRPCSELVGEAATACGASYSPILSASGISVTMAVGLVGLVALITGFTLRLAKEGGRSIQAATGMAYLAVILAPSAEFAAKIRYF